MLYRIDHKKNLSQFEQYEEYIKDYDQNASLTRRDKWCFLNYSSYA